MNHLKILLVSNGFYPELSPRSFRATELAKEFCRQGYEVTVISKYRNHNYTDFLKEYPINFKMLRKPLYPRIPEFKAKPFSYISRGISRLLSVLFEYPAIEEMFQVRKILKKENGYDLMISFAIPYTVHWGVSHARSDMHKISKVWVADCGDPYMFARLDTFKKPFYFKYFEKKFCSECDNISIPNEQLRNQFYPEFSSKIVSIPQGFNFEEVRLFDESIENTKPVFVFAGSIIPGKRDLKLFLEFLASVQTDFLFIVYTNQHDWFKKYRVVLGEKLEIKGYIDRLSLIYQMSKADFLVNVETILDTETNIEAIPSKLIDYALSGRPILNINSGHLDKELVMQFLAKNYSGQRVIDKSVFDIKKVSAKFIELLH